MHCGLLVLFDPAPVCTFLILFLIPTPVFLYLQHLSHFLHLLKTQILETLHKRLGHLSTRNVKCLQTMSFGIKIGSPATLSNADRIDCLQSGQHRLPSHIPTRLTTRKLEVIHSDVCGPMKSPPIVGKEVYFVVLIDDFNRMTWIYGLVNKSDAFHAFQHLIAHCERECDIEKVLTLRTDNGDEYVSKKMQDWCTQRGIILQTTQPYSPDMNGIAERSLRTIIESASAMLWGCFLGLPFWYEAVKTAVYMKNRRPHAARDKTPYELWTGSPPSLAHLRVFGYRCYALVPDKCQIKWESYSNECLFMAYYPTFNLHRLFDLTSNSFVKCRDVVFHECIVGHHGFANNRLPLGTDITGLPLVVSTDDDDEEIPLMTFLMHSIPKTLPAALASSDSELWNSAMVNEIEGLQRNNTWSVTSLPPGKSPLDCKWVFALRPDNDDNPAA